MENIEINVQTGDIKISTAGEPFLNVNNDVMKYQRLRALEYPPITDYPDGIVKEDKSQVDKYIADCLAVKEKYPKP